MKYQITMTIDLARERVIELFDDPDNLPKWQPGLLSIEPISGEMGQVGAQMKLLYKMGKREIEMIETITERNLPEGFSASYEANNVMNYVSNRFLSIDEGHTQWVFDSEFQCKGFMRIMTFLMPWVFKKESTKFMQQFKDFAEAEA